ncbi:DUF4156 domain-containing protein, partial [Klebsiella pneumoniae]|uniref:DUF4156 domain-containing protein n=1 Tax=Klebsiella pneumoniae TaxID=573 RepID=UPI00209C3863
GAKDENTGAGLCRSRLVVQERLGHYNVTGSQGNFFTGGWTSNSNLETGARNDLKNKAWKMGGNVVVLLTQRAGQTGSVYHGTGSSQQTNVTLSGTVYRCR